MFFNSFLSLFDNKGSYKIVPCKFFCSFFTPTLLLVAKQTRKTTLYDNIITIIAAHTPEQKKEALRPLLTFMVNPLRNGTYNSDRSYRSHRPSYR